MNRLGTAGILAVLALTAPSVAQPDNPSPVPPSFPPARTPPGDPSIRQPDETQPSRSKQPPAFDEGADARKLIAAAMKSARKEHRRILIVWGNNQSKWCRSMHSLFQQDRAVKKLLDNEFDLVLVDVGNGTRNLDVAQMYRADLIAGGLPFLTVLDSAGAVIANQETGKFELKTVGDGAAHNGAEVLRFLEAHKPPPIDASAVLKSAMQSAKDSGRRVFLYFGAPWCGWCRKLDAWLEKEDVAARFGKEFVDVKIDNDRMKNAKEIFARYNKGHAKSGIPWFAIVDPSNGEAISTSDGPKGNIGFPASDEEIAHFVSMLKAVARKLSDSDIDHLKHTLEEGRKK